MLDLHTQLSSLDSLPESDRKLFPADFNIDPAYEFAKFLYKNGEGVSLTHIDEICTKKSEKQKCFTWAKQPTVCLKSSQVNIVFLKLLLFLWQ